MGYENILVEKQEGIATIILNRPQVLNALNRGLIADVAAALEELDRDEEVRALIITGAGDRAFSAGADIHEMVAADVEENLARYNLGRRMNWGVVNFRRPVIGAINGIAFGGGALLATACDIRIGSHTAKFRFPGGAYGRVVGTWSLPLIVGLPKAKELIFTGRVVEAEEAARIGLLNAVVPLAELRTAVWEMAHQVVANNEFVVAKSKELMNLGVGRDLTTNFEAEAEATRERIRVTSPTEAFQPFLERKGKST